MAAGTLYLVGTPIGNLGDMSDRAKEVLAAVDVVAAEDTRRTGRLLAHFGIQGRLVSFFEGNERERSQELLGRLRAGEDVAVVSDAGMPGLSDPGFRLVRSAVEADIDIRVVPGPSAALAAVVVSGLPTDRFVFEGFLPRRPAERRTRLGELAAEQRTLVLFESPRRLARTLADLREILGDRQLAVARELTKIHEEVIRGRASEVLERLGEDIKGEIVLVIEGAEEGLAVADLGQMVAEAEELIQWGMRARPAAGEVARRRGASANDLYRAIIERRK